MHMHIHMRTHTHIYVQKKWPTKHGGFDDPTAWGTWSTGTGFDKHREICIEPRYSRQGRKALLSATFLCWEFYDKINTFFPFFLRWFGWVGWFFFVFFFLFCLFRALQLLFTLAFSILPGKAVRLSFWVSNHHRFPGCQLSKLDFVGRYWRGESLQNILHLSNTYLMINTTNVINVVLVPGLNRIFQLACFDIDQESSHLERVCVKIIYRENNDKPNVSPALNPELPRVSSKLSWPRSEDASGCAFHVAVLVFEGAAVTTEPSCVFRDGMISVWLAENQHGS